MERQAKSPAQHTHVRDAERVSRRAPPRTRADNRPGAIMLRKLAEATDNDPRMPAQREPQGQFAPVQRSEPESKSSPREDNTGLPDGLKLGIESLSGFSVHNVKVHYNSSRPAEFNALAYARGNDIHIAPGQERHLPHEAWHVVQQAQGRVTPTLQLKDGVPVNDDAGLEREADVMGARALRAGAAHRPEYLGSPSKHERRYNATRNDNLVSNGASYPLQRVMQVLAPVIHTPAALSAGARARLQSAATTLATTLHNDGAINLQSLIISVEQEGGQDYQGHATAIRGDNPAVTNTLPHGGNPPDIEITIQRPFAETATEGELLGLLAHEVGAHNLPDLRGVADAAVNVFAPIQTPRKILEANTPSGGYEFQNWPVPAHGAAPARRHGNRQHDHVMLADILRNPPAPGMAAPLTRANVYFQTVLNIGDTIWASARPLAERTTQTNELVHIYLVDIARIIASDDSRMPPALHALAIDDLYGEVFNQVVLPYQVAHPWIPAARPKSNAVSLGLSLAGFIAKVKFDKLLWG